MQQVKLINTTELLKLWSARRNEIKRLTVKQDYSWIHKLSWLVNCISGKLTGNCFDNWIIWLTIQATLLIITRPRFRSERICCSLFEVNIWNKQLENFSGRVSLPITLKQRLRYFSSCTGEVEVKPTGVKRNQTDRMWRSYRWRRSGNWWLESRLNGAE